MTEISLQQVQDTFFNSFVSASASLIKHLWLLYWPYIILFIIAILAGILLQIRMLKSSSHRKLPAWFNRLVGSLTYSFFFVVMVGITYLIWGTKVIDEIWFALFGVLSFPLTGFFLRKIGFWYY